MKTNDPEPRSKFPVRVRGFFDNPEVDFLDHSDLGSTPLWEAEDYFSKPGRGDLPLDPWELEGDTPPRSDHQTGPRNSLNPVPIPADEDAHGVGGDATCAELPKLQPRSSEANPDTHAFPDDLNRHDGLEAFDNVDEAVDHIVDSDDGFVLDPDVDDDLFEYDPDAHQLPWEVREPNTEADETAQRRSIEKAAFIASRLNVVSRIEQKSTADWLQYFFLQHSHSATFRAITDLALNDLTPAQLQAIIALRQYWQERPDWWMARRDFSHEIRPIDRRSAAISWALAWRICTARCDYEPEDMIDECWFDEWLELSPGVPGYRLFAAYVDAKITGLDCELLFRGLSLAENASLWAETGDDYGWWRKVPSEDEAIRYGFNVRTPFRAGFDPPGYVEMQTPVKRSQSE